jgi:hypothetical protein
LRRRWCLSSRDGFEVLSPSRRARRDSGVFVEMKPLFFIAPKDEKGGEVTKVFLTEKQASGAEFGGVRRGHRICCLTLAALCWCVSTRRAGGQATDARRQRLVRSPWWHVLTSVRQTRWWCYDRRVTSASVDGGVSRAQRQRRRWAASDVEARLLPFRRTRLLSG